MIAAAGGEVSRQIIPRVRMTAAIAQEFSYMTSLSQSVEIFCIKCRAKTTSRDIEAVTMKNGRPATRSICTECGTSKFRIGILP